MTETTEKAILAGDCFWGMQDLLRKRPDVISTRVGYTGGDVPNATYRHKLHISSRTQFESALPREPMSELAV